MKDISRLCAGALSVAAAALALTIASPASAAVQATAASCAKPDGHVGASVIGSGVAYLGGTFTHVVDKQGTSQPRAGLAAIDTSTCDLLPWRADTNNHVYALALRGSTVYAGGDFTTVGGQSRSGMAALDATSAKVLPFSPNVSGGTVRALAVRGTNVYAGGSFTTVNGTSRSRLAAFDATSGALSGAWTPKASGTVLALTPSPEGGRIYVGGSFTALNGATSSKYAAAVDPTSGALSTAFKARVGYPVLSLAADSRGVYAAGAGTGGHLVIWNLDGSLQRPVYQTDGDVQAVAASDGTVFAGGHFDNYCVGNTGGGSSGFVCDKPLSRHKLFAVSLATGEVTSWAPRINSILGIFTETIDPATGDLWIGGDFTLVNGVSHPKVAVFRSAAN